MPHSRRAPRAARAKGFSLLEVIAAVMLLAIAFTALMRVAGSSIDLGQAAAERSEAAMWARSLLDSAFVLEPLAPGSRSGRFDERYGWQLDVQPWASPELAPNSPLRLYRLDLAVRWRSGGHVREAHFDTLRVGTAQAAPGVVP
ncbi:type IV pilus modification PilV family protein [Frateuria defendens]|uniref:type IV pilus modification PilV family protein n=1 Tax=Frateuria defendens TaxID=2219559 RepID=UPI00235150C1|nr:prepilin-type N-terminal cleavage/methylation domain-containing protein [Frateuria defendens]